MSWKAEIEEIHYRRRLAEQCGGPDAVARHHADGKLTPVDAAKAKWWSAQVQNDVLDECVQLHGGIGLAKEMLVEKQGESYVLKANPAVRVDARSFKMASSRCPRWFHASRFSSA